MTNKWKNRIFNTILILSGIGWIIIVYDLLIGKIIEDL